MLALLVWGFVVLAFAAGGLADATNLWWLVLIFGAAFPVVLAALHGRALRHREVSSSSRKKDMERELLDALARRGGLSPASAALTTSLTVDEAAGMLQRLAQDGHLEVRPEDGTPVYALGEWERRRAIDTPGAETAPDRSPARIREPLSEREREVLRLVASGRSNREISQELHVAPGTVKAHVANIYRKLEAHNRMEAVRRARELGLL